MWRCSRTTLRTGAAVTGSNVAATFESGETALLGSADSSSNRRSVWYKWTPASAGTYTVSTETTDIDTVLGVYDANGATSFSGLSNVSVAVVVVGVLAVSVTAFDLCNRRLLQLRENDDCADGGGALYSCVTLTVATGGSTYAIQVDGYGGASGPLTILVSSSA